MRLLIPLFRWNFAHRGGGLIAALHVWGPLFAMFAGMWRKRTTPLLALIGWTLGLLCNGAVVLRNGGRMPTTADWSRHPWCGRDCDHPKRLLWLGDIFHVGHFWLSLGDLLLAAGSLAYFADWAWRRLRHPAPTKVQPGTPLEPLPIQPTLGQGDEA